MALADQLAYAVVPSHIASPEPLMSLPRFNAVLLCLSVCCTAAFAQSSTGHQPAAATQQPAYVSDPHYTAAIHEATLRATTGQYGFAIDAYRKANKIAGNNCTECLHQIAILQLMEKDNKAAVKTATELVSKSTTPLNKSKAEALLGQALLDQGGDKPKPPQLQAADQALRAALADYPRNVSARFLDGEVLARMGDTDAARAEFKTCIEQCPPTDPYLIRAKRFAENPALSYAKMAPAFTVTALDGTKFTLDEMDGRVVLIDFWATWCGPCNEELPELKRIAKDFAGEPLVMISISSDTDEAKWKEFIQKHEMTWHQYRDTDDKLGKLFGVESIPHYFTIDSDGVLTSELVGSGNNVEGRLKKLIAKAKQEHPATQTVAISPGS
jgi:peroxiredoxin/Flp pilus assembly protein TadD